MHEYPDGVMLEYSPAPINTLAPELMSQVMREGLPGPKSGSWKKTLQYLRSIGAVSSGWRQLRDHSALLWTYICFEANSRSPGKDDAAIALLDKFLHFSKNAQVDFALRMTSAPPNQIPLVLLTHIRPHLHRFRSVDITSKYLAAIAPLLPLPVMPSLQSLMIQIYHDSNSPEDLVIFAEKSPENRIQHLSIDLSDAYFSQKNINTQFITYLDLRGPPLTAELLSFATQCPALASLALESSSSLSRLSKSQAVRFPISFPYLTSLELQDSFPLRFPSFLSTPRLAHITFALDSIGNSANHLTDFSSIRTMTIFGLTKQPEIIAFLATLSHLEAVETDSIGLVIEFIKALNLPEDGSKEEGASTFKCPSLQLIRLHDITMTNINDTVVPLFKKRSRVKFHFLSWSSTGSRDWKALESSFPGRLVCGSSPMYVQDADYLPPLSDLF